MLHFYHHDHLGTVRSITDKDGTVVSTHEHAAYGEELSEPEFETNRMKFTGHERDPETNLDYMLARYYASAPGTFLQPDPGYDYDPMDPMSWNLYGYVRGNPVMGVDPTGKVDENAIADAMVKQQLDENNIMNYYEMAELDQKVGVVSLAGMAVVAAPIVLPEVSSATVSSVISAEVSGAISAAATSIIEGASADEVVTNTLIGTAVAAPTALLNAASIVQNTLGGVVGSGTTQYVTTGEVDPEQALACGVFSAVATTFATMTVLSTSAMGVTAGPATSALTPALSGFANAFLNLSALAPEPEVKEE